VRAVELGAHGTAEARVEAEAEATGNHGWLCAGTCGRPAAPRISVAPVAALHAKLRTSGRNSKRYRFLTVDDIP
jgi:hypothetical protein